MFFYDINDAEVVWHIYDALILLKINHKQQVWYMTRNRVNCIEWGTEASQFDIDNLDIKKQAPEYKLIKSYIIDGKHCSKDFNITAQASKLVEAVMHHNEKRVTVVFRNYGAFTYQLNDAASHSG